MQSSDETELLTRAREYDSVALGELYDRYSGKIYSYILYQVSDEVLAEDLTANVFTKVLGAIQTSKAWQTSFASWLYRIAHNAVIDHYRRNKHDRTLPLDERLVSAIDDPVSSTELALESEAMVEAMAYLTSEQRTVIALKFLEGYSNIEVAQIMSKTEGAIKSLQYRALRALRRELEGAREMEHA